MITSHAWRRFHRVPTALAGVTEPCRVTGCGKPRAEHGTPEVDWSRYRTCPACFAVLGEPCLSLSGLGADGGPVAIETDRPHGGRQLRAGYGR